MTKMKEEMILDNQSLRKEIKFFLLIEANY